MAVAIKAKKLKFWSAVVVKTAFVVSLNTKYWLTCLKEKELIRNMFIK